MFVECNDNSGFEDQLTDGSTYQVLELGKGDYLISNDKGIAKWYGASKFTFKFVL